MFFRYFENNNINLNNCFYILVFNFNFKFCMNIFKVSLKKVIKFNYVF